MFIRVDPLSSTSIFEQIVFQTKGAVARGELKPGDRLPSVRELAKQLAVNPNTVVKAYDALTHSGVIVRRQGAGCFVSRGESVLDETERLRRLDALIDLAVTEAFHLGFGEGDLRDALARALKDVKLPRTRSGSHEPTTDL